MLDNGTGWTSIRILDVPSMICTQKCEYPDVSVHRLSAQYLERTLAKFFDSSTPLLSLRGRMGTRIEFSNDPCMGNGKSRRQDSTRIGSPAVYDVYVSYLTLYILSTETTDLDEDHHRNDGSTSSHIPSSSPNLVF
ncbi:uncharacterized protein KY384_003869 [Bacidia gigantensis]|uniref:uncharacterized protein n=1 Tax=Bacidia gigantensis TaxID=2732470 RepID=UPI001D042A49|nr:uncharacterized protein KY384_003869 [Bacidia gigantensis]KAG8532228.1 hypothetical protein KY384_003869 [Bacidia gigantensis]